MSREQQILALLAERREHMTVADIGRALGAAPESVRSAAERLYARKEILRRAEQHEYPVGNQVARHIRYRYFAV